jgi:hypothetical protein
MFKNVASQKAIFFAFDVTTNLPKTGDAANITPYVSKDFGTVTVFATTTITELDATNAKGFYTGTLSQAETNADTLLFSAKSSTANIVVLGAPATVFTNPANFTTFSIDGSGRIDLGKILGTAVSTPATAGVLDVNVKNMNNVAATSITTVNANIGSTQPLNFTGTAGSATVKSDMVNIAGSAVSTSTAQIGANIVQIAANATSATNIQRSTAAIVTGTVGASSTTTSIITSALSPAASVTDQFKGRIVTFDYTTTTAALRGQATDITGSSSGGVLTVTALTTAPASGDTFSIT